MLVRVEKASDASSDGRTLTGYFNDEHARYSFANKLTEETIKNPLPIIVRHHTTLATHLHGSPICGIYDRSSFTTSIFLPLKTDTIKKKIVVIHLHTK